MSFKYYDLLSNLVPGFLLLFVLYYVWPNSIPDQNVLIQLTLAFISGYFINTFSSWLEGFYRFLWGGNIINDFLDKDGIWKVKFYDGKKVKEILQGKVEAENNSNKILFNKAMQIAYENSSKRLEDFNASYAFSRSLITALLISGLIGLKIHYADIWYYLVFISLFIIGLIRCKQRDGYYVREAFNLVISSETGKETD